MQADEIQRLIREGESLRMEFKEAQRGLPRTLFETVCAFLNRTGGHLLLGVGDDGTLLGIAPEQIDQLKREFAALSNNPTKLQPPFSLELTEVVVQDVTLLYTYVPQSSQVHRCDNVVFDRRHEGDFRVTSDHNIRQLYARKSGTYSEGRIYPFLTLNEFKPGLLEQVRRLIRSHKPNHTWLGLDDQEFLRQAGLFKADHETGKQGYTLAAALLFGRDEVIHDIVPHYRTDVLVRRVNVDRYDDRLVIRSNLVEAYDQLMEFVGRQLPDTFFLHNDQRRSLRDFIFREVTANLLIHREYMNALPARFIIYADRVEVENANKALHHGLINPAQFSSFPKNPTIARFFVQLGYAEELGSGIRNITQALLDYAPGRQAQFVEDDTFLTIVPVPASGASTSISQVQPVADRLKRQVEELGLAEAVTERLIHELAYLQDSGKATAAKLAKHINAPGRTIRRDLSVLRDAGLVELVGYDYRLTPAGDAAGHE